MRKKKESEVPASPMTKLHTSNGFTWFIPKYSKLLLPVLREVSDLKAKLADLDEKASKQDGST